MGRGKGGGGRRGKGRTPKFDLYGVDKMKRGKSGAKGAKGKKKGKTEAEKMKDRKTTARTHTTGGKAPSGRMAGRSKPGDVNADAAKANFRDFQQGRFPGL